MAVFRRVVSLALVGTGEGGVKGLSGEVAKKLGRPRMLHGYRQALIFRNLAEFWLLAG